MNWYYVDAGQQAGPVDDAQLAALAHSGKILGDTLVWREGMDNWQTYGEVMGPPPGVPAASPVPLPVAPSLSPSAAVCAECGRMFDAQDMIPYGGVHVCAGCKPVFMQKLAEGAKVNTGALNYAGFWIRVGAKVLDGLILGVVFGLPVIIFAIMGARAGADRQEFGMLQVLQLVFQLLLTAVNICYQIFFLGKMACGLRVVTGEGGKITYGRATGRAFAEILSGMICYIGYLMVAFDDQKRGLHDHICNTRVVYK